MKLTLSIWNKYLLGITFLLSYINTISTRIDFERSINWYTFTPDAPIYGLINAVIIYALLNYGLKRNTSILFPKVHWTKLSLVVISCLFFYLIISNTLSFAIAVLFGNVSRNFNSLEQLALINFDQMVDYCLYATIFMAYLFHTKNLQQEQHLQSIKQSLNESTITNLRAQLNPHFLFNNLNSLDELIHEDQERASDFLADFANLYRFCLEKSDKQLIPLNEELDFAQSYFDMLEQKYPNEYKLNLLTTSATNFQIPPFTCQTLIENAIEHNRPAKGETLEIKLQQTNDSLTVSNPISAGHRKGSKGGRALHNLQTQFELLDAPPMEVNSTQQQFVVQIPLIKK